MSNRKMKIKRESTKRGFRLLTFKDDYGEECSLQMSSRVEPHVWLGITKPKKLDETGWVDAMLPLYSRMHLNQKQARQLARELIIFADTGELE